MGKTRGGRLKSLALGAGLLAVASSPALAEFQGSFYFGWNDSFDSDVTLGGNGLDVTFQQVPWLGLSFFHDGGAPYYGARAGYWLDSAPHWGIFLDYTHAKVRADPDAMVSYSGTTSGSGLIGDLFEQFEFTDGINVLTLNAFYRTDPMWRFQPYFGAGAGINVPHVEVESIALGIPETFQYEFGGLSVEALAGVDFWITDHFAIFAEYKMIYSQVDVPLNGGFDLQTSIFTNQIAAGVSVRLGN